jgi:sigma-B regulation protein RsbU (phosphoserine phosphatase)
MDSESINKKFEIKELELNSLLEITQSINSNLPEDSLYKIFNFTLRANLKIKKIALYVKDDQWECKVNFGTKLDFNEVLFDENAFNIESISDLDHFSDNQPFSEFEKVIPVSHKKKLLAVVFVGGYDQQDYKNGYINLNFIQTLSNIIIVAIENKKLARKELEQKAIQKELEIARNVQQFLFPKELPYGEKLKIFSSYEPHQMVGGDYFDFIPIDEDQFLICIADVSGKGIPAALLMSNFQASLRTLIRQTTKLEKIVRELNFQILQNSNGESFITFFVAIYNKTYRYLKYVNAGHNPPLFHSDETGLTQLELGTTVLGIFHPLPFLKIGKIRKLTKFFFLAFTDGLIETFNEEDEPFGIDRVISIVDQNLDLDLKDLHRKIIDEANKFNASSVLSDDITLLSCSLK